MISRKDSSLNDTMSPQLIKSLNLTFVRKHNNAFHTLLVRAMEYKWELHGLQILMNKKREVAMQCMQKRI